VILTGPKIEQLVADGKIRIKPYDKKLVGPNSVDLRLADELVVYVDPEDPSGRNGPTLDMRTPSETQTYKITPYGFLLRPGTLYLGSTIETIGSEYYVPMVEGRSSCGRLGLQVHMTAGFCDTGFFGTITLEMTVVHPLRVYADTPICQVFFVRPEGEIRLYKGRYQGHTQPTPSRMHEKRDGAGR